MEGAREREEILRRWREQYRARRVLPRSWKSMEPGRIYLRCPSLETATRSFTKITYAHIKQFLLFCSLTALYANYIVLSGSPHDAVSICLVFMCSLSSPKGSSVSLSSAETTPQEAKQLITVEDST